MLYPSSDTMIDGNLIISSREELKKSVVLSSGDSNNIVSLPKLFANYPSYIHLLHSKLFSIFQAIKDILIGSLQLMALGLLVSWIYIMISLPVIIIYCVLIQWFS